MAGFNITDYLPFTIYNISGHSMEPIFRAGSRVMVFQWAYLFSQPKVGDVIIFKKGSEYWIKRIVSVDASIRVAGDNKEDSLEAGRVYKKDIIGKVLGG